MGLFSAIDRFVKRHSLLFNVLINILLALISIACYILLVILFLEPAWLQLESLVYVRDSKISPTVAIGLVTALLSGATATLVTRAVEHSLWLKLVPKEIKHSLTVAESRRLAQWSVSMLARVLYAFSGTSWVLKFAGLLLLATAVVNPVLLSGVTPIVSTAVTSQRRAPTQDMFTGFLDRGNMAYNGGNYHDNTMSVAAIAAMSNVSAPASTICLDSTCKATANTAAIQASCSSYQMNNTDDIGLKSSTIKSQRFRSKINPSICTDLVTSNPSTLANFTAGQTPNCNSATSTPCPGEWATLFGVWTNAINVLGSPPINAVDCTLRYGNVTVTQTGNGTPQILPNSFIKSPYPLSGASTQWHRIYIEDEPDTGSACTSYAASSYTFATGVGGADGSNTLYRNSIASLLLNYANKNGSDAATVARQIERNFDMGALFAFARAPGQADVALSTTMSVQIWKYDAEVLAILAVPLLATVLLLGSGRWRVGNYADVVGYDPVEIARRGPVLGGEREEDEKVDVWAVKGDGGHGPSSVRTRLMTG